MTAGGKVAHCTGECWLSSYVEKPDLFGLFLSPLGHYMSGKVTKSIRNNHKKSENTFENVSNDNHLVDILFCLQPNLYNFPCSCFWLQELASDGWF